MKKQLFAISLAMVGLIGCAHQSGKVTANEKPMHMHMQMPKRTIASMGDLKIDLRNIYSMQKSYWSDNREGKDYFGKFSAFIVKDDMNEEGNARLLVYLESPENMDEMNLLVDNNKFLWSGVMAGTEPSLSVNRKNSLLIESGNDAVGRFAWRETITAKILANTGKIEVIGYDYTSFDKHMEEDSYSCSYNFLTGAAKATTFKASTEKTINRKVKGIKKTIALNDWSSDSVPADCVPKK